MASLLSGEGGNVIREVTTDVCRERREQEVAYLDRADLARRNLPQADLANVQRVIVAANSNLSHSQERANRRMCLMRRVH